MVPFCFEKILYYLLCMCCVPYGFASGGTLVAIAEGRHTSGVMS